MSAKSASLSSKPVIATVLCVLAIVAAVNVVVFKPGSTRTGRAEVRVQASQPVPFDLDELRQETATPGQDLAAWAAAAAPTLQRDPFGNPIAAAAAPATPAIPATGRPKGNRLLCNAVLLGGLEPAALINGKAYRIGDPVGKYRLDAIGARGVKLSRTGAADLYLSVSEDPDRTGSNRVVTETTKSSGLGGTSLVEQAQGERK
jgi:hypothetical protein